VELHAADVIGQEGFMTAADVRNALQAIADPEVAAKSMRFFKTGPGEYGEGDRFLGVPVPAQRQVAKEFRGLDDAAIVTLLQSPFNELRSVALMVWVAGLRKADDARRKTVYDLYRRHVAGVNNWNLVDVSCQTIVGGYLIDKSRAPLFQLAKTPNLWERRIAIVSTQHFIRHDDFGDTLELAKLLLDDPEDLLHKATGWMLREVGDRDPQLLRQFLDGFAPAMPRTMLRYSIEKFPEPERKAYLGRGTLRSDGRRNSSRFPG
jgi:3-methyladenine DNA glycosylase AlkD